MLQRSLDIIVKISVHCRTSDSVYKKIHVKNFLC